MTQNTKVFSKILGRNCTRVTFVAVNKNFSQQKLEITKRPLALKKKKQKPQQAKTSSLQTLSCGQNSTVVNNKIPFSSSNKAAFSFPSPSKLSIGILKTITCNQPLSAILYLHNGTHTLQPKKLTIF